MSWWLNKDYRDDPNEKETKKVFLFAIVVFVIYVGVLSFYSGCSLVELHVETQQTSRTLSEAKRNPITENSEVEKQDSTRTQENPKTTKVHVPVGTPKLDASSTMGLTIDTDVEDSNPTGSER